jgi:hypothetical protein
VYTWPTVPGATQYQITVPAGSTVISGSPTFTNTAFITWGTTGGNVIVKAQNNCGISGSRTLAVTIAACRTADNGTGDFETLVYPNPAHDQLQVKFDAKAEEVMTLRITDFSGRVVRDFSLVSNAGENFHELEVITMTPGMYLLSIQGEKSGKSIKTIVIQ